MSLSLIIFRGTSCLFLKMAFRKRRGRLGWEFVRFDKKTPELGLLLKDCGEFFSLSFSLSLFLCVSPLLYFKRIKKTKKKKEKKETTKMKMETKTEVQKNHEKMNRRISE